MSGNLSKGSEIGVHGLAGEESRGSSLLASLPLEVKHKIMFFLHVYV